jgi:16S rRNA (guanine966-N2)-methyltransferase
MRVIAGKFRSRSLRSLRGMDIRPTSDRLRETLFNVLTAGNPEALSGTIWVDLFAGTGAVGIEALSRGAAKVYFVEKAKPAADVIRENIASLAIMSGVEVLMQDVASALKSLEQKNAAPDFIFIDPPYREQRVYGDTLAWMGDSDLATHALTMVEHDKRFDPGDQHGRLRRVRVLRQGDAALSFYRLKED